MDVRIAETVEQLRNRGLSADHKKILRGRLKRLWIGPSEASSKKSKWRQDVARQAFSSVQGKSAHLCFVLILLLSLTQCGQKAFCDEVITPLLHLESFDTYHFSLSLDDKSFLEGIAKEEGFVENPNFIAFMQTLFPDGESTFSYNAYTNLVW